MMVTAASYAPLAQYYLGRVTRRFFRGRRVGLIDHLPRANHVCGAAVDDHEMLVLFALDDREVLHVKFQLRQPLNGGFSFGVGFEDWHVCIVLCRSEEHTSELQSLTQLRF